MKYNPTKKDRIVVFYNDSVEALNKAELQRWEFRFAGTKASKGFAPMYVYDLDTRELSALVTSPVNLPDMAPDEFYQTAFYAAARGGGLWQRPMSKEEIAQAIAFAQECVREGRRALFFANRAVNFKIMAEALAGAHIPRRTLDGGSLFEERDRVIREFNTPYQKEAEGTPYLLLAPVVLLLTDAYATGVSFHDPAMVVVHLDFPEHAPALIEQRESRVLSAHPGVRGRLNKPLVCCVSRDIDRKITESLAAKNQILDSL